MENVPVDHGQSSDEGQSFFQELCKVIGEQVFEITTRIKTLEDFLKLYGTSKDNVEFRNKILSIQRSINEMAIMNTKEINKLKCEGPKENRQLRLQTEKLEDTFVTALKKYSYLQQEIPKKEKQHPLIIVDIEEPYLNEDSVDYNPRQSQIYREMEWEKERMLATEQMVQEVETKVLDINQIMNDLGQMVHEQNNLVDKIESDITEVNHNIEKGNKELEKALNTTVNTRRRCLIISIIIMVIVITTTITLFLLYQ